MKKLAEIENEIASTDARISELESELNTSKASFEATQTAFIAGKANLDELHAEQSKLTLLAQAIDSLKTTSNELQTTFGEMTEAEARQTLLESARSTALQAETLFNESLELRRELDNKIGELAEKFLEKLFDFHEKRRDYLRLRGQFPPDTKTPGLSNDVVLLLEKNHLNFPAARFGLSIGSACGQIEREMEKAAKSSAAA